MWVTGDESPEVRARHVDDVNAAIEEACAEAGMRCAPPRWVEKRPGGDRVPPVPEHVQGSRVRLMVAEADVLGPLVVSAAGSFVAQLDRRDLQRLRTLTRQQALKAGYHGGPHGGPHGGQPLTDAECDEMIEAIGPDAAVETLRAVVGRELPRAVH